MRTSETNFGQMQQRLSWRSRRRAARGAVRETELFLSKALSSRIDPTDELRRLLADLHRPPV
jgi:hypothetical protein